MPLNPQTPLIYLITSGATTARTTTASEEFANVLCLADASVAAGIDLLQIREKNLSARVLYQLAESVAGIMRGSATKLLVNDRSDVASAAGADGVHLAGNSLPPDVIRRAFGPEFVIGVSTHSLREATAAKESGADFVVFGPVFETESKRQFGKPLGLEQLQKVASAVAPLPVLALGGVELENVTACLRAGSRGVAAIRMLNDPKKLDRIVNTVRESFIER
jgi:thiamine-phosphate pyrophosphorylase